MKSNSHSTLKRFGIFGLLCVGIVGVLFYWRYIEASGHDDSVAQDSHQWMLVTLEKLRQDTERDDPVFGAARLDAAQSQLRSLTPSSPTDARINALSTAGDLELLNGQAKKAAEHLGEAFELLEPYEAQVPPEIFRKALMDVAVANLRLGEVENCIECNTCESCILPIRNTGLHSKPSSSRQAVQHLERYLTLEPDDRAARWLLNVAYMTLGEHPDKVPAQFLIPESAFANGAPFPRFSNDAGIYGVDTVSLSGGVIADDFNGDGWIDLVTSDWAADGQLRFFTNAGQGHFRDDTKAAGLEGLYGGLNLVQADYDNDGALDILVLRGAWRGSSGCIPNSLLRNDGKGHFVDVTMALGLNEGFPTQTASWADFDNDGDLDLFVGNEGYPCQLFRNDAGAFTDIAEAAGVTNDRYTKGVSWGDFNGDRFPDLYVSNYGTPAWATEPTARSGLFETRAGEPNRLYRNNRDGTFTDIAEESGVTRPLLGFPTWFWDVNNDGNLDLFVASYSGSTSDVASQYLGLDHQAESDRLYMGDGQGGFQDVTTQYSINRVSSAMGGNFGDLDNDGFDDFYLGTGAPEYSSLVPNVMYRNRDGIAFEDVTAAGGFGHLQKGHAIAFADFDNDGDQDVYCVLGGAYPGDDFANGLFVNPTNNSALKSPNDRVTTNHHWLAVELRGVQSNRFGIGGRIKLEVEQESAPKRRSIYKWVNSGGSFGANPLRKEIGLGEATSIVALEIYWPTSDTTQRFEQVAMDSCIRIIEGQEVAQVFKPEEKSTSP